MAGDPITMCAGSPSGHTGTLGGTGSLLTLVTVSLLSGICDVKKVYTVAYSMTTSTFDFYFFFLLETIAKLILLSVEKG